MPDNLFSSLKNKRIILVAGHYGSGKTEFSVNLALSAAENGHFGFARTALIDLDIINPYFRSREREQLLADAGIQVYGNFYKGEVTAEIPALSAAVRAPLEDPDCFVVVDLGGNNAGVRVSRPFLKYFKNPECLFLAVVNANRPETAGLSGALEHLAALEAEMGMALHGLVNNCHLIRETTAETVLKGHDFCLRLSRETGIPLLFDCYPAPLCKPEAFTAPDMRLLPLGMHMRQSWLDK